MILDTPKERVVTNANTESNLGLEASAEAFAILSDSIYEHKIAAVVRELSCNAYDSHVSAGKEDVPIHVQFPTILDPYFAVTDEGLGLDDEGVRDVFLTYFKSTKRNTNAETGFLGLGSKSPLAYTTSFLIRARKDGMEREYTCYIGDDDRPKVNMMYQCETDEHDGVRVALPVQTNDFSTFRNEARFIFSFFDTTPETNDSEFTILLPDAVEKLEQQGSYIIPNYWSQSSLYHCNVGALFVNMGNVCYRVSRHELFDDVDGGDAVFTFFNRIVEHTGGYIIRVPMGSVKFQASRERLSLKENTIEFLREEFLKDAHRMMEETRARFASFTHPMEVFDDVEARRHINSNQFLVCGKTINHWFNRKTDLFGSIFPARVTTQRGMTHNTKSHNIEYHIRLQHMPGKVILYYNDKSTGIVTCARDLALRGREVLSIHHPMSEARINRLKKIFITSEFVNLDDHRKKMRDENSTSSSPRGKLEKTEVRATYIDRHGLENKSLIDLDNNSYRYFYIHNPFGHAINQHDRFSVTDDINASPIRIGEWISEYDSSIRVIVTNKQNQNKVARMVPHISELVNEIRDHLNDNSEFENFAYRIRIRNTLRGSVAGDIDLVEAKPLLDVIDIDQKAKDLISDATRKDDSAPKGFSAYRNDILKIDEERVKEKFSILWGAIDVIKKKYPLLKMNGGGITLQEWRDYVMMVNSVNDDAEQTGETDNG